MRKVVYYVACSVDRFIAHEDGTWGGFPAEGEHVKDYLDSLQRFDAVLMGRKTYEDGLRGTDITDPYPTLESYLFSRTLKESPDRRVKLVSDDASSVVKQLKQAAGRDIYLCGGAELAAALFAERLVDEIILKMYPVLFGSGIPLFSGSVDQTDLELFKSKIYQNGAVFLYYRLKPRDDDFENE